MNQKLLKFFTKPQTPQIPKKPKENTSKSNKLSEKDLGHKPSSKKDIEKNRNSNSLLQSNEIVIPPNENIENLQTQFSSIENTQSNILAISQEKPTFIIKEIEESPIKPEKVNESSVFPESLDTSNYGFKNRVYKSELSPLKSFSRKNSKETANNLNKDPNREVLLSNSSNTGSFLSADTKPKENKKPLAKNTMKNRFSNNFGRLKTMVSSKMNLPSESLISSEK